MSTKLSATNRPANAMPKTVDATSSSPPSFRPRLVYDDTSPPSTPKFPLSPSTKRPSKPQLNLNQMTESELTYWFQKFPDVNRDTACEIVEERNRSGDFIDGRDFDRRVSRMSFSRLSNVFDVSFSVPPPKDIGNTLRQTNEQTAVNDISNNLENLRVSEDVDAELDTVVFATWNCAQMSPRSSNFAKKCQIIERLVSDTPDLDIIVLQELYSNSAALIAQHLRKTSDAQAWTAIGCGSSHKNDRSLRLHTHSWRSSCQAALYNESRIRCVTHCYVNADTDNDECFRYQRPPHVCVFERIMPRNSIARLLVIATCHISFANPQREIVQLPNLLHALEFGCARSVRCADVKGLKRDDVVYVLAGDFNRNANSPDFQALREHGYVELVAPRSVRQIGRNRCPAIVDAEVVNDVDYLRDETTSGGQHYDNIFVSRSVREQDLLDAWVYIPGGTGRRLRESGRTSAVRVRGERSDHRPIVVQLKLGRAIAPTESLPQQSLGSWRLKSAFQVHLRGDRGKLGVE